MDPAKRVCLKNLPEGCTKREIAEMIKTRTGAQPHSIDLGLDASGEIRRYAHFSCEGAKKVLDVMGAGVALRDATVHAYPARMHYSFRYGEARRKREREEEDEKKALEEFWVKQRERFLARTNNGELPPKEKPPRDFYFSRRKYGTIASEIADKLRKAHKAGGHVEASDEAAAGEGGAAAAAVTGRGAGRGERGGRGGGRQPRQQPYMRQQPYVPPAPQVDVYAPLQDHLRYLAPPAPPAAPEPVAAETAEAGHSGRADTHTAHKHRGRQAVQKHKKAKVEKEAAPPPPPPPPPQPTKEERKLTGLQAKLAALKEKMKK